MTRPDQTRPDHSIVRNSSFELLRIVAMLMIVASHFSVLGGFDFPVNSITLNRLWLQFVSLGNLGNNIFVMLSGYFLINSKELNFRRILNLWSRIFFWSVMLYGLFVLVGAETFSLKTAVKVIMPVTQSQWWFASTYFVMYLIHPYVNRLLHSFTREEYRKFLLSIGLYWCIIPTLAGSDFGANRTITFVCLYSIAGYVSLYFENFGRRNYILYGLVFIGVNLLSVIVLDIVALKFPIDEPHIMRFYGMMKPFTILASLCLLIGFRSLNIPHNKLLNMIASATFGVYLIHENNFVRPFIWKHLFCNASFQDSPYLIPYSIAVILTVYISCTVLELMRSKVFRTLTRGYLS